MNKWSYTCICDAYVFKAQSSHACILCDSQKYTDKCNKFFFLFQKMYSSLVHSFFIIESIRVWYITDFILNEWPSFNLVYYLWGAIRFLCWFLFLLFWIAHFQKSFFFFKICHYLLYNNFIVFMSVIILCCQHSWCYICLS